MAEDGKILTRHVFMKQKYISDIHSAVDSGRQGFLSVYKNLRIILKKI